MDEATWIQKLDALTGRYDEARQVAETILASLTRGDDVERLMQQLAGQMQTIAAQPSPAQETPSSGGPAARAAIAAHRRALELLIETVARAEQSATLARDALAPQLDLAAIGRKVRASYQQGARI